MVTRHGRLAGNPMGGMHLSVYIKSHTDECYLAQLASDHCRHCCIRCHLGPAEQWSSLRVIGNGNTEITDLYIHYQILSCFNNTEAPIHQLASVSFVPQKTSQTILLGCIPARMLFLANDTSSKTFHISKPTSGWIPFPWGMVLDSLRSMHLEDLSLSQIMGFRDTMFPNLEIIKITSKGSEYTEVSEWNPKFEFESVKAAILELNNATVASALLASLKNLKELTVGTQDPKTWSSLLSTCISTHVSSISVDYDIKLDDFLQLARTYSASLNLIRLPRNSDVLGDVALPPSLSQIQILPLVCNYH